jgi:GNAT superfamily N-acetyltransferase
VPAPPLRLATLADTQAIGALVRRSMRGLAARDYGPEQVEGSLDVLVGVDRQLLLDGTYYVAEAEGRLVAAGGWSARAQLYGPSREEGGGPLLDPATGAARIRAFFVDPSHARQGLARRILERCEATARARGFRRMELMALLSGVGFYVACGYREMEPAEVALPGGVTFRAVRMEKELE